MKIRPEIAARVLRPRAALLARGALLAVFLAGAGGCEPFVEGNGNSGEQLRDVQAFGGLVLSDGIQALVTVGPERSVKVRGDENVLEFVETNVENHAPHGPTLVVRAAAAYVSKNELQVVVSSPSFTFLSASEASPATVTGAAASAFTVEASDGSNVSLAGAGGHRLVLSLGGGQHGGARIDARNYPVEEADVALSAGASAAVAASVAVTGTADAGSRLENVGAGACSVASSGGAQVVCAAP